MKNDEEIDLFVRYLSDDEIDILKYFYIEYSNGNAKINSVDWPNFSQEVNSRDGFLRARSKFHNFGIFRNHMGSIDVIADVIVQVNHRIEHPPLPNHWQDLSKLWFSKKWSLPITIVFFVVPSFVVLIKGFTWLLKISFTYWLGE